MSLYKISLRSPNGENYSTLWRRPGHFPHFLSTLKAFVFAQSQFNARSKLNVMTSTVKGIKFHSRNLFQKSSSRRNNAFLFSILRDTTGREIWARQRTEFFISVHLLHISGVEQCQLKYDNMSEEERSIVLMHVRSAPALSNYICTPIEFELASNSKTLRTVRDGLNEFRVNVAPEFALCFDHDTISRTVRDMIEIQRRLSMAIINAESSKHSTEAITTRYNLISSACNHADSIAAEYQLDD